MSVNIKGLKKETLSEVIQKIKHFKNVNTTLILDDTIEKNGMITIFSNEPLGVIFSLIKNKEYSTALVTDLRIRAKGEKNIHIVIKYDYKALGL